MFFIYARTKNLYFPFHEDVSKPVCCRRDQADQLMLAMEQPAAFLSRCPSCFRNFRQLYCQMTCSVNQSDFLTVKQTSNSSMHPGQQQLDEVEWRVALGFANRLHDSCAQVELPSAGTKSMTAMCGDFGDDCNSTNWLHYLGTKDPSPFQVDFEFYSQDSPVCLDARTSKCNESTPEGQAACACGDCPDTCAPPSPPSPPNPFLIFGLDGYQVSAGIAYVVLFILTVVLSVYKITRNSSTEMSLESASLQQEEKSQQFQTKGYMSRLLGCLASLASSYPLPFVAVPLFIVIGLSLGLLKLNIETDPVALWSAPDSQVRLEKE